MARRSEKLSREIKRSVAPIIEEMSFSSSALVTVIQVEVSPDFDYVKIYIGVLPEEHREEVISQIQEQKGAIKRKLAQRLRIRRMPEIDFRTDQGLQKAERVERLLKKIDNDFREED